tara:strand:+ start:5690 stop:6235 length:546 start_codon:yes stop_codon:yes gene_type:complete
MVQDVGTDDGLELTTKGQIHTFSTENTALNVSSDDYVLTADSTTATGLAWLDSGSIKHQVALVIACGTETDAISATGQVISFRIPYNMTLNAGIAGITGSLVTAGTGVNKLTVDIEESGSSILSTALTFDSTESTTTTASVPVVISDTALTADSVITINVTQLDSGGVSAGLKISLIGSIT